MKIKTNTPFEKPKSRIKIIPVLLLMLVIGIGVFVSGQNYYSNISLVGKWKSEETGAIVEFTDQGLVKVNEVEAGKYIINEPDSMVYSIEGHDFQMNYKVEGRDLVWGLVGEGEKFQRNGL